MIDKLGFIGGGIAACFSLQILFKTEILIKLYKFFFYVHFSSFFRERKKKDEPKRRKKDRGSTERHAENTLA